MPFSCVFVRFGGLSRLGIVRSAWGPLRPQRSRNVLWTRGGQLMTTSAEHEPKAVSEDAIEAWHEAVDLARQERRQRGERYTGRHRPAPPDSADEQTQSELSA